jgi:hypothetical protein
LGRAFLLLINKSMKVEQINIDLCNKCNRWKGNVEEKYNGTVPVYCACAVAKSRNNGTISPSMICPKRDKFYWTPISEHIEEDGKCCHTPHFAGPSPF